MWQGARSSPFPTAISLCSQNYAGLIMENNDNVVQIDDTSCLQNDYFRCGRRMVCKLIQQRYSAVQVPAYGNGTVRSEKNGMNRSNVQTRAFLLYLL